MKLNEPIGFGSKPGASKQGPFPEKTTINLVGAETTRDSLLTQIALFAIVLALAGIFAKFAVIDPLASGLDSNSEVAAAQEQLAALEVENASYAEVNAQYERYVAPGLTEDEQNLVDRDTVIDLLETKVMNVGYLSSVQVEGNVAVVTSLGASLDEVSRLVESLEADKRVAHVTVSTAQNDTDVTASATIQITFVGALDAHTDDGAAGENATSTSDQGEGVR